MAESTKSKACPKCRNDTLRPHCKNPRCNWDRCRVCRTTVGPGRVIDADGKPVVRDP